MSGTPKTRKYEQTNKGRKKKKGKKTKKVKKKTWWGRSPSLGSHCFVTLSTYFHIAIIGKKNKLKWRILDGCIDISTKQHT